LIERERSKEENEMLSVTRWEPYRDMLTLQGQINRILGDALSPASSIDGVGGWLPPVDIVEEADRLVFRAEIPGVDKNDIDVKVENGTLVLRGEKKQEKEIHSEAAHRIERFYGSFSRSFVLPTSIDASKVEARYRDGVLELVLPKADEARPRKITIQS
jgi:HSP20 family protein